MTNYYDLLEISSSASSVELTQALDRQYDHWRRLVTHHEPGVAQSAQQKLLALERARVVLTDPARRAAYDAQLGAGGLADPTAPASPPRSAPPPPPPAPTAPPARTIVVAPSLRPEERVDVWLCPKCGKTNAVGVQFCRDCGRTLGVPCPQCGKLIESAATFCSACGVHVAKAGRYKELQAAVAAAQNQLAATQASDPRQGRAQTIAGLRRASVNAAAWLGVALLGVVALIAGWDRPIAAASRPLFAALAPYGLALGLLGLWILVVMIARRSLSLSALMAFACAVILIGVPFVLWWALPRTGTGIEYLLAGGSALLISGIAFLMFVRVTLTISRFSGWALGLILLALPAALGVGVPAFMDLVPFATFGARERQLILTFAPFAFPAAMASYGAFVALWGLDLAWLWRLTGRGEHELRVALAEKQAQLECLDEQLRAYQAEMASLGQLGPGAA